MITNAQQKMRERAETLAKLDTHDLFTLRYALDAAIGDHSNTDPLRRVHNSEMLRAVRLALQLRSAVETSIPSDKEQ